MILKRWCLVASVLIAANLALTTHVISAESFQAFRQKNGLQAFVPPETRALMARLDFSKAEQSCPRNLPIGRMMEKATKLLA
jgi:hypothetical protein